MWQKIGCKITNLCASKGCYYKQRIGTSNEKLCQTCKSNCNSICTEFTKVPNCKRIKKFPYVCNGCSKIAIYRLNRYYYDSVDVWKQIQHYRKEPRKGTHSSDADLVRISKILVPLIIEKK